MVFVGTCTGGRVADVHEVLDVLRTGGSRIAPGVQLVVTPASREVERRLTDDGTLAALKQMGATITTPGCGACCGTSGVIPAAGTNVLSTANRNFKARMGPASVSIYLASPAACAAAALTGRITDPAPWPADAHRAQGRARRFGDDVNTDYIIASTRKRDTLDESVLKQYLLETVDPDFAASVRPGDIIVGGRNFGCGSAMEIAATVILAAGIRAVVAESFARTFYRNAINNGLVPVECDTADIREGDRLEIVLGDAGVIVRTESAAAQRVGGALPEVMRKILSAGGLVSYVKANGGRLGR